MEIKIETVNIDLIKPYWRNPRNNDQAIEPVKESIKRFGYTQPITLDKENVIVTGHTRYKALKQLGITEIPCIRLDLSPQKAKEYRIIDNKTSEFASWTNDFVVELREFEDIESCEVFFPDIDIGSILNNSVGMKYKDVNKTDISKQSDELNNKFNVGGNDSDKLELICPECGNTFYVTKHDFDTR